ncbi:MAG: HD domain-containing phosphohydrolase [Candidatus Limnocylindrales bacterium]
MFAASLALVSATTALVAFVVTQQIATGTVDAVGDADQSLAAYFMTQNRLIGPDAAIAGSLTADAVRPYASGIDAQLARMVASPSVALDGSVPADGATSAGLLRIKVHGADGTVLFSDDAGVIGTNAQDDDLTEALDTGEPSSSLTTDLGLEEQDLLTNAHVTSALEEYLPITDASGHIQVVFEVYRSSTPLLAAIADAQRAVVLVLAAASLLLAGLLYLIFRAAARRLDRQTDLLLQAAHQDALTGLLNHGAIVDVLGAQVERARLAGTGMVGLALVDVDNFRLLNDTHGHGAGDSILLQVGRLLRGQLSQASVLGRFGPDEFLAIAPPECAHDLEPALERLRAEFEAVDVQFAHSEHLPVSFSAGVAYYPAHGDAVTELLSQATIALMAAKASGGDAVHVAERAGDDRSAGERSSFDVLQGLIIAVDTKDRYTKRHSEDVARYALFLADRVGLDPDLRRTLHMAGLLHDVGKIGIPDTILRKPGPLTAEEYDIVKQHVALGDMIVRDVPNLELVRAGVRHHHERWDGHGYLDRLIGEEIPLIARILAVGDAFSAMTPTRPYRKALSVEEALRRLTDAAGSQLDAQLVTAFVTGMEQAADAPLPGTAASALADVRLPPLFKPSSQVA